MNHLILSAHPNPESFCRAVCNEIKSASEKKGNKVTFRDLYDTDFAPILTGNDLAGMVKGIIPENIKEEQAYIARADHITIVFPVWWGGVPAVMKGYFDRALSSGFAYAVDSEGVRGLLTGKKASVVCTAGTPEDIYEKAGITKAIRMIFEDVIFKFCGIEPVGFKLYGNIAGVSRETRESWLAEINKEFEKILE